MKLDVIGVILATLLFVFWFISQWICAVEIMNRDFSTSLLFGIFGWGAFFVGLWAMEALEDLE